MKSMSKKYIIIAIYWLAFGAFINAQNKKWVDHFSYRNAMQLSESESYVLTSSGMGLMIFDKLNGSIDKFSKVDGLSDYGISAIQSLGNDVFIIGYSNGNIDIFDKNEIYNIPDFKLKQIQVSKQINHFFIHDEKAYCSTDYALLVVDLKKYEVTDTYFLGLGGNNQVINETVIVGNEIYAATDRGLLKADLSDPKIVYDEGWKRISASSLPHLAVINHGEQLVTVAKQNSTFQVVYGNEGDWNTLVSTSSFKNIRNNGQYLIIAFQERIISYNEDFTLDSEIKEYSFDKNISANDATYSFFEDVYYITDNNYGLVEHKGNNDIAYLIKGPYSNICFDLHATSQGVYSTAGGLSEIYDNLKRPIEYSFYNYETWDSHKSPFPVNGNTSRDLLRICSSSVNDSNVFIGSWGGGLYSMQGLDSLKNFDENNSKLQNIYANDSRYIRIGGVASDSEGNIWMSNSSVDKGIVVKSNAGWQTMNYEPTNFLHSTGQFLITRDNQLWIPVPMYFTGGRQGIIVINTNGTLLDDSDDEYRSALPKSDDNRNKGQLLLWDDKQKEITKVVLSMAEDKNGYIWLGTDKGILVYYRPWAIFSEQHPVASRIKIPRNDGTNFIDYLLEKEKISAIAVDGANRKWIGTEDSGVYLVSEDGLKTYQTFNIKNSPLPSNTITSLAITPHTGEVFIGTAKGIVSYKARATEGNEEFSKVYAYPNPVREDYSGEITITGLVQNSIVKITTVSGKLVHETISLGGVAYWDGTNFSGNKVKSGVYIVYVSSTDGSQSAVAKVLIIR
jgi:hypothetical protein